jgi:formylglycine-generating enzyme
LSRFILLVGGLAIAVAACSQLIGLSDLEEGNDTPNGGEGGPGDGGDAGEASAEAAPPELCSNGIQDDGGNETDTDCGGTCGKCAKGQKCKVDADCAKTCGDAGVCEGCAGVELDAGVDGGACIDPMEVTVGDYDKFRQNGPRSFNERDRCRGQVPHPGDLAAQLANAKWPVRNVQWCAAFAFCRFNGKRLCGGFDGKALSTSTFMQTTIDQWTAACSLQGQKYPYGDSFNEFRCNDEGAPAPEDVGKNTNCVTFDPVKAYDMSGNVAEWEDSCEDAGRVLCRVRGGSFKSSKDDVACAANRMQPIATGADDIGFRCCE